MHLRLLLSLSLQVSRHCVRDLGGAPPKSRLGLRFFSTSTSALTSVVHRDLKPGNCLVTSDGTLEITDFGLVKVGLPEEAVAEQRGPTPVRAESVLGPGSANVLCCPSSERPWVN